MENLEKKCRPWFSTVTVKIFKEEGDKCPRCWKLFKQLDEKNQLCDRCMSVINEN